LKLGAWCLEHQLGSVRGRVPRKQGLKLAHTFNHAPIFQSPRASSKKTRIETIDDGSITYWSNVRGRVPRKQGLKLRWIKRPESGRWYCPRASSKKTRIETRISIYDIGSALQSEGEFQENKDWNSGAQIKRDFGLLSEGEFQENKDWN